MESFCNLSLTLDETIGKGSYSTVYLAECDFGKFAIKKFNLYGSKEKITRYLAQIALEVNIIQLLQHKNIVKSYGVCNENCQQPELIMEYMPTDLLRHIDSKKLNIDDIRIYSHQLLEAVNNCHINNIVHRDIKPANILIDPSHKILKLCDFGCAKYIKENDNRIQFGSSQYLPPETLLDVCPYQPSGDLWSAGCVILQMCTGRVPFVGKCYVDQLVQTFMIIGSPTTSTWSEGFEKISHHLSILQNRSASGIISILPQDLACEDQLVNLLTSLLTLNPTNRCSAETALQHSFFYPKSTK